MKVEVPSPKSEVEMQRAEVRSPKSEVEGWFLTKSEVAERLSVTPQTVGAWARNGMLPAYRIGGRLRFKWPEVEQRMVERFKAQGGRQ